MTRMLAVLFLFLSTGLIAQIDTTLDNELIEIEKLIDRESLDSATAKIDKLIEQDHYRKKATAWYLRGAAYLLAELSNDKFVLKTVNPMSVAFESFQTALTLNPSTEIEESINGQVKAANYYLLMQGAHKFELKAFGVALEDFESGIKWKSMVDEVDSLGYFNAALAAERVGDTGKAIHYYQKCIDYGYEELDATYYIVNLFNSGGRDRDAKKFIEHASKKFPEYAGRFELEPYLSEYRSSMESGDVETAYTHLATARDSFPGNFRIYMYMARHQLSEFDSLEGALSVADRGIEQVRDDAQLYYLKGMIYESSDLDEEALEAFENATTADPEFGDAWYNMGAIWYSRGHEATMKGESWRNRHKARKQFKKARPFLEKAYEIQPSDLATVRALRNVYYQLGEKELEKKMHSRMEKLSKEPAKGE